MPVFNRAFQRIHIAMYALIRDEQLPCSFGFVFTNLFMFGHVLCEVHRGSIEIAIIWDRNSYNASVEIPFAPCIDKATVVLTSYSGGFKKVETKEAVGHWVNFNDLPCWTYNDFVVHIECGLREWTFMERLDMVEGGELENMQSGWILFQYQCETNLYFLIHCI